MQFLQEAESQLASNANNDAQTSDPSAQQPGTPQAGSPMAMSPQSGSPQPVSTQAMMPPHDQVLEVNHREGTEESMDVQHDKSGRLDTGFHKKSGMAIL